MQRSGVLEFIQIRWRQRKDEGEREAQTQSKKDISSRYLKEKYFTKNCGFFSISFIHYLINTMLHADVLYGKLYLKRI